MRPEHLQQKCFSTDTFILNNLSQAPQLSPHASIIMPGLAKLQAMQRDPYQPYKHCRIDSHNDVFCSIPPQIDSGEA